MEKRNTTIVNAFGGPGAGKTTAAWHIAAELKKRGFVTEYIPEYAKELVWDEKYDLLDGTIEHETAIYEEKLHRINRVIGKVDFVVTDSPTIQSISFLDDEKVSAEDKAAFVERAKEDWTKHSTFNLFVQRDSKNYEKEGRIHSLDESKCLDQSIKSMLKDMGVRYGIYNHQTIDNSIDNMIKVHHARKVGLEDKKNIDKKSIFQLAERINTFMKKNVSSGTSEVEIHEDRMAKLEQWITKDDKNNLKSIINSLADSHERMIRNEDYITYYTNEIREANDLIYSLKNLDQYKEFANRTEFANSQIAIKEFRNKDGRILEGERIPWEKSDVIGHAPSIVLHAVEDYERRNHVPKEKSVIAGENSYRTETLYKGYDIYVAMSHINDLSIQPYMKGLYSLTENMSPDSILPLVAEVYYAQQNGLSQEQIHFMLENAGNKNSLEKSARNLRHDFESELSSYLPYNEEKMKNQSPIRRTPLRQKRESHLKLAETIER